MPLNHDEAAVSITVTGVSLGCVNPDAGAWEVGFIRHPAHALMLEVTRHTGGATEVVRPNSEIPAGAGISVGVTKPAEPGTRLFTEEGDPEDFNLIVDIENDIYGGIKIPRKQPEHEVTPLRVRGAVLYSVAEKQSDFPVNLIVKGDEQGAPVKKLGHIGTAAGADVRCEPGGEVVIKVDGPGGFELRFPHAEGTRYTVALDNTCPADASAFAGEGAASGAGQAQQSGYAGPGDRKSIRKLSGSGEPVAEHSDFVLYYAVLAPPQGAGLFDLVKDKDENDRGDGAVCNFSHLGVTTRLFPIV